MHRMKLCLVVVLFAGSPAFAAELTLPSTIASVTVYPVGATVIRTANMTLPVGASTVFLEDLPIELDPESLKVEGKADHAIAIASVDMRPVEADAVKDPRRTALEDEIQVINDRIAAANGKLDALAGRKRFLEKLIETTPAGFGKALGEGGYGIAQWAAAATTIGDGLVAVAEAEHAIEIEKRALNRELEAKQKELADLPELREHIGVRIALSTDAAAIGTLSISYRTHTARWLPTYDAQLSTGENGGEPSLAIVRRASVIQSTGEDWNNVALSLSTAPTAGGTAIPYLSPFLISLYDPDQRPRGEASGSAESIGVMAPSPTQKLAADSLDAPAEYIEAAADFGDFRAVFHVPGLVTVESGVGSRSMQLATDRAGARIEVRAVPMLDAAAYLQASFTPPAGAPLLAGRVALFRDGVFVGNGDIPFTNAGKSLDLGFGVDDRVRVTRVVLERTTGEQGILSSRKTDLRRFKITVENLHTRPIDITVLDRVPYAEDDQVEVYRIEDGTPPTATDLDDRRGVLAWSYTYAASESRDILNGYEVSWPSDREVVSLE